MTGDNQLFPVFLCADKLNFLIVGGGAVGLEKVSFMFRHTQNGNVKLVAEKIDDKIVSIAKKYSNLILVKDIYNESYLENIDVVIAATNDRSLNEQIRQDAKNKNILVNVADTPDLCDFYLSSVIKKGDLKIAISSNGKSPTMTKRIREFFEDVLPEELDDLIQNLNQVRDELKGDFQEKVKKLNQITSELINKK